MSMSIYIWPSIFQIRENRSKRHRCEASKCTHHSAFSLGMLVFFFLNVNGHARGIDWLSSVCWEDCVLKLSWIPESPSSTQHSKKSGPASTERMGVAFPPTSLPACSLDADGGWRFGSEGIQAWGC